MHLDTTLIIAAIGLIALLSQWLAWRTKAPSIVFLLAAGILVGPVFGYLNADELLGDLLFPIVSMSVSVILFEGSLTLRFHELRDMGSTIWRMLTIGVLATWVIIACATHFLVALSWSLSILFGAIMVVTGPTVIGPMLRSVRPNEKISRLLRWEGIVVDPLGAVLAIVVFEIIVSQMQPELATNSLMTLAELLFVGIASGMAAGYLLGLTLRNYWLPEYLHNVGVLLIVVAVFAFTDAIAHESGLVAVTVMGIWLANMPGVHTEEILDFKESLSVLLISVLFILLASRLDLAALGSIWMPALGLVLITQFVARPLKILVSTWPGDLTWNERGLLAWIAPRGIVAAAISALFALRLEEINYPGAEHIVPLAFALIIGTVLWQGFTAPTIARWLKVAEPAPTGVLFVGGNLLARTVASKLMEHDFRVVIADSAWDNVSAARMSGMATYFGNPVSEHAERHLNLIGLGHMFAMSRRDDMNALACVRFANDFGRNAVYTISTEKDQETTDKHKPVASQNGDLFGPEVSYSKLAKIIHQGGEIKTTKISENFEYEALAKQHPTMIPLLAWTEKKDILVNHGDDSFKPKPGATVMFLSPAASSETISS